VVRVGRDAIWYREGQVPDTVDGRFDMIATILSLVLIRLERAGGEANRESVLLTELFIDDMEGNIRQLGTGDPVVGKRIGKMMGAVGGRLGAYREALESGEGLGQAVRGNIFRSTPPSDAAVTFVADRITAFHTRLLGISDEAVLGGELPAA